jgi:hypothetical protein
MQPYGNLIPSFRELESYNVNRPDSLEVVRASLYDSLTYPLAGTTQLRFFQLPIGQGSPAKTLGDTNMQAAGSLPSPISFLVETIQLYMFPTAAIAAAGTPSATLAPFINDLYLINRSAAWLDFFVGSKSYLQEAPLMKFPPSAGLAVGAAVSDTTTAGASQARTVNYATNSGPVYEVNPPLLLTPTQNFNITLNWATAQAISANAVIYATMSGILYRNSQ